MNATLTFIRQFTALMRPRWRAITKIVLLIILFEAAKLVPSFLSKQAIDTLSLAKHGMVEHVFLLAVGIFVANGVVAGIDMLVDRWVTYTLLWAEKYLPTRVQEKLLALSLGYHEREQTGQKIAKLERGTEKLIEFLAGLLYMMMPLAVQLLYTFVVMVHLEWTIAVVFALSIPLFVLITWRQHSKTHPWRKCQEDLYEQSSGQLGESIMNIQMVQAAAQEKREAREYAAFRDRIEALGILRVGVATRADFFRAMSINTALFVILPLAATYAAEGTLSIGTVVLFLVLAEKAYSSLSSLTKIIDHMVEAVEPLQRLMELLETPLEITVAQEPKSPVVWEGRISFCDVSFGYGRGEPTMKGVSFVALPGETVALVGPSGGGKSTVVKLLLRYYDPNAGQISVDGVPIAHMSLEEYRQRIGYVEQEVRIMSGTIRKNVAYGRPDATDEDVERVARLARVDEFVNRLPLRYETPVGEHGVTLSGGQRQRIGIARALLMKPSILVFDEATSSLDTESEHAIQLALEEASKTTTTIVIAHRLSTIRRATKILVLDRGEIVEEGDHERLMLKNGLYHKLVELQRLGAVRE